jgi:hypothetical protein
MAAIPDGDSPARRSLFGGGEPRAHVSERDGVAVTPLAMDGQVLMVLVMTPEQVASFVPDAS